jgi:hypothetical protein
MEHDKHCIDILSESSNVYFLNILGRYQSSTVKQKKSVQHAHARYAHQSEYKLTSLSGKSTRWCEN